MCACSICQWCGTPCNVEFARQSHTCKLPQNVNEPWEVTDDHNMDCAEAESQADALTPRTMRAVVCGHDALSFNVHVHAVKSFICTQWPTGSSSKARWSGDRSAAQSCCQVCHWQALKGPWRQEKVVHSGALSCPKTAMPIQRGTSNSQSEWGGKFCNSPATFSHSHGDFCETGEGQPKPLPHAKEKDFLWCLQFSRIKRIPTCGLLVDKCSKHFPYCAFFFSFEGEHLLGGRQRCRGTYRWLFLENEMRR